MQTNAYSLWAYILYFLLFSPNLHLMQKSQSKEESITNLHHCHHNHRQHLFRTYYYFHDDRHKIHHHNPVRNLVRTLPHHHYQSNPTHHNLNYGLTPYRHHHNHHHSLFHIHQWGIPPEEYMRLTDFH